MSDKTLAYTHHAAYTMAGLLAAGGLYGGLVKGSRASVLGSALFATGYAASGLYAQSGEYLLSNQIGALTGGALALTMGARFMSTRGAMPLILSLLGTGSATFHGVHWSKIEPIKINTSVPKQPVDATTKK